MPRFLYVSQVLQAEGIKIGAEHLRRSRPETMGSIFWQLNDCWPVASWSSIDYYGRWKALQYYARRFYAPVLVSPHVEDGALKVYIVSDRQQPLDGTLRVRVLTMDGTTLDETATAVTIPAGSSRIYLQPAAGRSCRRVLDLTKVFVTADLTAGGPDNIVEPHLPRPNPRHPPAGREDRDRPHAGAGRMRIAPVAPVLARSVYVSFGDLDVTPSDDYFDLLPGQTVEITLKSGASPEALRGALKVVSLADAF